MLRAATLRTLWTARWWSCLPTHSTTARYSGQYSGQYSCRNKAAGHRACGHVCLQAGGLDPGTVSLARPDHFLPACPPAGLPTPAYPCRAFLLQRARELLGEGDQGSGGSGIKILLAALSAAPGLQTLLADAVVHRWVAAAWVGISCCLWEAGWALCQCVPASALAPGAPRIPCAASCPQACFLRLLLSARPVQPTGPLDLQALPAQVPGGRGADNL